MTWMGPLAGITTAICASPFIATSNLVALAVWPTWVAVAVTETIRKYPGEGTRHFSCTSEPRGMHDYDVTVLASAERLKLRLLSLSDCLKVTPKSVPFLGSMPASLEGLNLIGVICDIFWTMRKSKDYTYET
ncbi:hypothetical protein ZWY2020_040135 [Hordeum vulgare]|nr:hypothetical protein ZWY2020_040135 [Hordeum vulgare]